jgi:PIN domain nuclease of toxin-antitoxin system
VRLLLDTHTFLWFLSADPQLSATARGLIEDGGNDVYLSVGGLWEMAIKISLGKLSLGQPFETFIPDQLARTGIALLSITFEHTARVVGLPMHHRDPFDRLLIAQALVEGIPIVGMDAAFDAYGVARLW